ncbi:MAG: DUF2207 domain-containing protein, partial [Arenimonas sp.]|uniref:DUF2207 domain-containing protein n=1 Tax=Arenimonas sp. TaxID=1872635 RepID=UPI0025BB0B3C
MTGRLLVVVLACLSWLAPAAAQERILSYDSELSVRADGSLDVVETIRVRAEGNQIRRGIYRDFPTRYRDRLGNRMVVDFELLGVERNGRPEPYFTEARPNGVRINTGSDDYLPVPSDITFTLRYRTTRQLGFFDEHDEIYWNVTGLGWDFPIEQATARVQLPAAVPRVQMRLDGYTGADGEKGKAFDMAAPSDGVATFRTTAGLGPQQGLTVVVGFPKGLVTQPSRMQRWAWFLRDNGGVLIGLAGLMALVGFYAWRWHLHGRDPQAGPIFPLYVPPEGFTPGEMRMLRRMGHDHLCFASDVVDMAVHGYLHIHEGGSSKADGWRLVRVPRADAAALGDSQRALAEKLFAAGDEIVLKNTEASRVSGAILGHMLAMTKKLKPRYFIANGGSLLVGLVLSVAVGIVAGMVAGGTGVLALLVLAAAALAAHVAFAFLLKAPTREGRKRLDEIEGLRMYLGVAERDELKSLQGPVAAGAEPALDAGRYEALLPYAMALEVEKAWTVKFIRAVGESSVRDASPSWYHGRGPIGAMGLASMGSCLGNALTREISSSSTPPGSSSGGGGGGSSGGGGGGGGGGGRWSAALSERVFAPPRAP